MLPGTQRLVLTPGNNEKRYLAGAQDPLNGRLVQVEGDRKDSWIFLHLLRAPLETLDALLDRVHGRLAERFDTQRRILLVA